MDYQVAKRVRARSLSDIIAANLVAGESYSGAFGKAIKQKSSARFTAIKEKFDPLNIAKFITGGSRLGPALLGRMLGRSRRDIEYFSGTARPIGGGATASRIGALPGGEGGSNLDVLTNIYKFLKTTQDKEKRRFELLSNRREEEELEKEKRHKELISAITGMGTGKKVVAAPVKTEGSFFDSILDMLKGMFESFKSVVQTMIASAIAWLTDLKPLMSNLLRFLGSRLFNATILSSLAGPAALALALGSFIYFTRKQKDEIDADPFNSKYDDNAYARFVRGEAKSQKQAGEQIRRETVRKFNRKNVELLVDSDLPDSDLIYKTGLNREDLKKWLVDNPRPDSMLKVKVAPLPNAPKMEAKPVSTPNASTQQLESATKQNQTLNLPSAPPTPQVNNMTNVSQTQKNQSSTLSLLDKITVRNPEETFQRMMYYSTRVV